MILKERKNVFSPSAQNNVLTPLCIEHCIMIHQRQYIDASTHCIIATLLAIIKCISSKLVHTGLQIKLHKLDELKIENFQKGIGIAEKNLQNKKGSLEW